MTVEARSMTTPPETDLISHVKEIIAQAESRGDEWGAIKLSALKELLGRASSTRSEVVEECAQVCDAYATGTYEHTCHIEFEEAASRIRALASPQVAATTGGKDEG